MYDLENFKKGKNSLQSIEMESLGDVDGKRMLHLQCHFGQDSLSWSRLGAKVTGIDLSPVAIETARSLNKELGLDATFIQTNIYDLPANLKGQFDLVFTSYGTIAWLPDLKKWASIINRFLAPGGLFFIADFHPTFYLFNFDNRQIEFDYFGKTEPYLEIVKGTYADEKAAIEHKEYFWCHSLEEVISPLLAEGLTMLEFREFDYSPFDCFPNMKERVPGEFVFGDFGVRLPHIFSLKMSKQV